jgi:hypothetical protein
MNHILCPIPFLRLTDFEIIKQKGANAPELSRHAYFPTSSLRGPYTINHVAQNCFAQHKFAHSRSSQSAPYTMNHVAQHAMLRNMIDRVWAALQQTTMIISENHTNRIHCSESIFTHSYVTEKIFLRDNNRNRKK